MYIAYSSGRCLGGDSRNYIQSHKKVFQMKTRHVGMELSKTSQTRWE